MLHSKKYNILKEKKMYLVFISTMALFILLGFFFYFIISDSNKDLVSSTETTFFNSLFNSEIDYLSSFINSACCNCLYVILIFILGLSVIGFIFIIFIILFKCFVVGFSISSIIGTYGVKGILLSILYVFPHQVLFLIVLLLMGYYSIRFCLKLFSHIFLKRVINFKIAVKKYIKVFIISLVVSLICSGYEVFVLPSVIGLFI